MPSTLLAVTSKPRTKNVSPTNLPDGTFTDISWFVYGLVTLMLSPADTKLGTVTSKYGLVMLTIGAVRPGKASTSEMLVALASCQPVGVLSPYAHHDSAIRRW